MRLRCAHALITGNTPGFGALTHVSAMTLYHTPIERAGCDCISRVMNVGRHSQTLPGISKTRPSTAVCKAKHAENAAPHASKASSPRMLVAVPKAGCHTVQSLLLLDGDKTQAMCCKMHVTPQTRSASHAADSSLFFFIPSFTADALHRPRFDAGRPTRQRYCSEYNM